jgi:hypothetical protein
MRVSLHQGGKWLAVWCHEYTIRLLFSQNFPEKRSVAGHKKIQPLFMSKLGGGVTAKPTFDARLVTLGGENSSSTLCCDLSMRLRRKRCSPIIEMTEGDRSRAKPVRAKVTAKPMGANW